MEAFYPGRITKEGAGGLLNSPDHHIVDLLKYDLGLKGTPLGKIKQFNIVGKPGLPKVVLTLQRHIQYHHPASGIFQLFPPFFVVAVVAAVKVQHILGNKDEFADALVEHDIGDIPAQGHDIVLNGIIPFAQQFNNGIALFVIGKQYLHIKRSRSKFIPLRVDKIIIYRVGEFKLAVGTAVKRRTFIFLSRVQMPPVVIWFYILQECCLKCCCKFLRI